MKILPVLLCSVGAALLVSCGRDRDVVAYLDSMNSRISEVDASNADLLIQVERLDAMMTKLGDQLNVIAADQAQQKKSGGENLETLMRRMEMLGGQINSRVEIPRVRWGYVDKMRVEREADELLKTGALPPDKDPARSPELAEKLAEYEGIQRKLLGNSYDPLGRPLIGGASHQGNDRQKLTAEEMELMNKKGALLKAELAEYFSHKSLAAKGKKTAVENAIREFAKSRFDLILDKTFGDHQIHYKSDLPAPDVTNQVIEFMRSKNTIEK